MSGIRFIPFHFAQHAFDSARIARQKAVLNSRLRIVEIGERRGRRGKRAKQRCKRCGSSQNAAHEAGCTTIHVRTIARPELRFKTGERPAVSPAPLMATRTIALGEPLARYEYRRSASRADRRYRYQ